MKDKGLDLLPEYPFKGPAGNFTVRGTTLVLHHREQGAWIPGLLVEASRRLGHARYVRLISGPECKVTKVARLGPSPRSRHESGTRLGRKPEAGVEELHEAQKVIQEEKFATGRRGDNFRVYHYLRKKDKGYRSNDIRTLPVAQRDHQKK